MCLILVVMLTVFFSFVSFRFCASSFSICSIGHAQKVCVCAFILQVLFCSCHYKFKTTFQPKCSSISVKVLFVNAVIPGRMERESILFNRTSINYVAVSVTEVLTESALKIVYPYSDGKTA